VRPSPSQTVVAHAKLAFQEPVLLPDNRSSYLSDHYDIESSIELALLTALERDTS